MSLQEKPPLNELVDELYHYGTKRHSGRYPYGSGEEPYQHSGDFISRIEELEKQGVSQVEIAKSFGMSTTNFRLERRVANNERRILEYEKIKSLHEKGYSTYKIAEMTGIKESTVRSKLDPHSAGRLLAAKGTYDFLKGQLQDKKYIDVTKDTEKYLNVSRGKLDEALYMLKMEGYNVYERYVDQATNPGKQTTFKVLCRPDVDFQEFRKADLKEIESIENFTSGDDGKTFHPRNVYPKSMNSERLQIRYAEDGGIEKDGIIELRRGVEDLSLGNSRYAQVRILVDDKKYLKGVAVYSDDMPDGVDVIFNTNKNKSVDKMNVLKDIGKDPNNPFGSNIKSIDEGGQYYYTDKNGKKQLGLINKRSDEGDWSDWANNLPSQFLSKQPKPLAEKQLGLAIDKRVSEFEEICSLTNPTVKKKLLEDFAEGCDSAAVHLKAAALPRQQYHVIIPITSLKDDEIYAPNYNDGEKVALIRYPHGGTFEIPVLTVNNKHATARKLLGTDLPDAVGINSKVAERLSGADFDGDTVMVIPTNDKVKIKSTPPLKGLEGFDPKIEYACEERADGWYNSAGHKIKVMKKGQQTGLEMGKISNLITDMTLKGATDEEKARAVKHSMVVIDAAKHHLDYKQSEVDNQIKSLKEKYQRTYNEETGRYNASASTLISRSKAEESVIRKQGTPAYNVKEINGKPNKKYDPTKPEGSLLYKVADDAYYPARIKDKNNPNKIGFTLSNGKKVWFDADNKEEYEYYKPVKKVNEKTGEVYFTNKTGDYIYKTKTKMQQSTRMAETDDAYSLVSDRNTPMERLYASYANKMKSLANEARKEYGATRDIELNTAATQTYITETNSLYKKLAEAEMNSPRERRAQLLTNSEINAMLQDNPDLKEDKSQIKKLKAQSLERNREIVGAKRKKIEITDKEWEAIQAGAISKTKLKDILKYADMDVVRSKAMPRSNKTLSDAQIKSLLSKNNTGRYTAQQLADFYNVPVSTIHNYLKGKE